ncbi:MAG: 50S ribosomal protein L23 [Candidatus Schekmanbacteria bacterium]|nr:50S ribosomal protein L23 [Candidatus Schekmanbacteria bacterium]
MNTREIIVKPLWTEKTTALKDKANQVGFVVDGKANKIEIAKAVESIFSVKVEKVRVIRLRGKVKRMGRHLGRRSDWKKAYVTLQKGAKIEVFEGV